MQVNFWTWHFFCNAKISYEMLTHEISNQVRGCFLTTDLKLLLRDCWRQFLVASHFAAFWGEHLLWKKWRHCTRVTSASPKPHVRIKIPKTLRKEGRVPYIVLRIRDDTAFFTILRKEVPFKRKKECHWRKSGNTCLLRTKHLNGRNGPSSVFCDVIIFWRLCNRRDDRHLERE